MISKNCECPDRAIELFSYMMSEHGQLMIYKGVEGVTYDWLDGEAVTKPEVEKLLLSDRVQYDKIYGADNAYWMFQDNVMQMKWQGKLKEPMAQLTEWSYRYTHYLGQYEIVFEANSEAGIADINIKKLWSETLPKLLLAPTEEEFDRILNKFVQKRETLDYADVIEESTRQINAAKEKLGLE